MIRQAAFQAALFAPEAPVPEGLIGPGGRPAGKRFDVYRNNVVVSLTGALAEAFPVVAKLVGPRFFTALAGEFLRAHPPRDPRLACWGDAFPGFLEGFAPAQKLPYLPDTARLEQALRESYHAADAPPLPADALQALPPEALPETRLRLTPATRVVASPWPIHGIWAFNMLGGPQPGAAGECVLITRPAFDPEMQILPAGGAVFVAALREAPLGAALDAAPEGFDSAAALAALIKGGAIAKLESP